jgi:type VI secretion system secreted protein VgrG
MPIAQANRPIAVTTPLGEDKLTLTGFSGTEGMSMPFRFRMRMVSDDNAINANDLLGKPASITIRRKDQPRYIHGCIARLAQGGKAPSGLTYYEADLVPTFWLLTLRRDSRIFQKLKVPDILEKALTGLDLKLKLVKTYATREFCVQYRETTFDFVSRLMEEEGIFYYFEHTANNDTLVLADSPAAVQYLPAGKTVRHAAQAVEGSSEDDVVFDLARERSLFIDKVTLRDHNFETPSKNLEVVVTGQAEHTEYYDYPGNYSVTDAGDHYARVRVEMLEAQQEMVTGQTNASAMCPGFKFDVVEHYRRDSNQAYQIVRLAHEAKVSDVEEFGSTLDHTVMLTAMPASIPFRPPLVTPRPAVQGTQTAVVVGPSGEEIWVDKYGRVMVQFHWDREGKKDENSSCFVRVATSWAGKNWGVIHIPRIGQEVIVDFLEGNPDRPIIIGSVYNAEQMPPYALPDNQTQSGLKTRSAKGGGTDNFNELRFEDKKGSEQIVLLAEKDLLTTVENDETRDVLHDRTTTIKNDETLVVKEGDQSTTVEKGDQTVMVSKGDQKITVDTGDQVTTVSKGDQTLDIKMGNQTITVDQGNQTIEIKMGNQSIKLGMGNLSTKLSLGNIETKCDLGSITSEAMMGIELKVGQSSIKVDQMGVTIKGMMVSVEGQIQTSVKGLMTQINGNAMLQTQGGITMMS